MDDKKRMSDIPEKCDCKNGPLPACAPLALGIVPFQQNEPPKYENDEALTRGTLFPGLDLPLKNIVNKSNPYAGTALGELMALDFVKKELNLYLDTHCDDTEAFELLQKIIEQSDACRKKYVATHGPISISDLKHAKSYTWLSDPWPWEYSEKRGK